MKKFLAFLLAIAMVASLLPASVFAKGFYGYVYFNMQGHGTQVEEQKVPTYGLATEPTAPTADGYLFGGWYKESECTNAWDFSTDTVVSSVTLYAKWTFVGDLLISRDDEATDKNVLFSLSPLDNININVYVKYTNDGISDYTDWKLIVKDKSGTNIVETVTDSKWKVTTDGNYKWCPFVVKSWNINTEYTFQIAAKNGQGEDAFGSDYVYSVATYCNNTIVNYPSNTNLVDFCNAIKSYGDTAKAYYAE